MTVMPKQRGDTVVAKLFYTVRKKQDLWTTLGWKNRGCDFQESPQERKQTQGFNRKLVQLRKKRNKPWTKATGKPGVRVSLLWSPKSGETCKKPCQNMTTSKSESETNGVQKKTGTDSKQRSHVIENSRVAGICRVHMKFNGFHIFTMFNHQTQLVDVTCQPFTVTYQPWSTCSVARWSDSSKLCLGMSSTPTEGTLAERFDTTEAKYWAQFVVTMPSFSQTTAKSWIKVNLSKFATPLLEILSMGWQEKRPPKKDIPFSGSSPQFSTKHQTWDWCPWWLLIRKLKGFGWIFDRLTFRHWQRAGSHAYRDRVTLKTAALNGSPVEASIGSEPFPYL